MDDYQINSDRSRNLIQKLIEKVDKCDWNKSVDRTIFVLKMRTGSIHIGVEEIKIENLQGEILFVHIPSSTDATKLKTLYTRIEIKVDNKVKQVTDWMLNELENLN